MKKRYVALMLVMALLLTTLLSGCGGGEKAAEPKEWDKIIRMSVAGSPYADPGFGTDQVSFITYTNVYDTLIYPNANDEMQPMLAKEWSSSPDGLVWTFNLRDDVTFHDGAKFTAKDVVFTANRLLTTGKGYAYLYTDVIDSVTATDDTTVVFKLKSTFAPFLSILCRMYIMNEQLIMANLADGSYGEFKDYGEAWLNQGNDAGSGAYYISDWKKQEKVCMTKFDEYWGPMDENAPAGFEMVEGTETATVRAKFASGELDISDNWQSTENYKALSEIPGVELTNLKAGAMLQIQINNKLAPTDDIHVRKALAHLLDYDQVINDIFPGTGPNKTVVPKGMPGYTEEGVTTYNFDMEAAKAELAQSKYNGKFDQYPINLTWIAEVADEEKLALLLQSAASQVGLVIQINKTPHMTNVENVAKLETTPNMNVSFSISDYAEAGSFLSTRFHSKGVGLYSQTEWLQSKEVDTMLDEALRTTDYDQRMAKYGDVTRWLADNCVCIPVGDMAKRVAYRADRFDWYAADLVKEGKQVCSTDGYSFVFKDFKCL